MAREEAAWTTIVERARARLASRRARQALSRRLRFVFVVALAVAASRALVWPSSDAEPLWIGAPRALGLGLAALVLGMLAVFFVARRKPTALHAARALDGALGLPDVVANGVVLREDETFQALARARADEALKGASLPALLPHPRVRPSALRLVLGTFVLLLAALVGGYDAAVGQALQSPPTHAELAAADALTDAARALREDVARDETRQERPDAQPERSDESRAESLARAAQRALARGDRERALERLAELRDAVGERSAAARGLDRLADRLARHLEPTTPPPSTPSSPGAAGSPTSSPRARAESPEERMRLLARRLREESGSATSPEERERTLERLARAADEARRSGQGRDAEQLADALSRAQSALSDGRSEDAARALEEAAARSERLAAERERATREAEALARLLERAGVLERAMQLARLGESGDPAAMLPMAMGEGESPGEGRGQGEGGTRGLAEGLAARLAALGLAEGPPGVGHGPGQRGTDRRTERSGLPVTRDLHAHSDVREGERAVTVLQGLGRNADAEQGYADVYPSYGAVAEDALADERVPAARREAVRRYFEAIRPE
ncbi:MAG: hypothetical protein H6724_17165 [Sandaracinus sp.]|nr:hypothetical protein [Sandaracinus sp.]